MPIIPALRRSARLALLLTIVISAVAATDAPRVLYTDALSGPTTGGEGGHGAYLSIFGKNFGAAGGMGTTTRVLIGGVEVANYRYLGPAKVGAALGVQQLTVQVGALGSPTPGAALPIAVVVGGVASNADLTFTSNPGRMLFVSLAGDDATAVAGDITRPWRHLQTATRGGAYGAMRAGDHVIVRGGTWTDLGFDTAWLRFRDPAQQGSAPTGASGTGWIHITAYPGPIGGNAIEDVHYATPAGAKGGIQGPGEAYAGTTGEYVSVSNLRISVDANATTDAAPINVQYTGGHWRIVNDDLGPWPSTLAAPGNARAGGISGCGDGMAVLGDDIHDIDCDHAALENHGIYADTKAENWEIAWCHIHDIPGGSLIQFNDALGGSGSTVKPDGSTWAGFVGIRVHHSRLENAAKYGLNIADAGQHAGAVEYRAWNNVITGTRLPAIRMNSTATQMDVTVAYNTLHQDMLSFSGTGNAYFRNEGLGAAPRAIRVRDNLLSLGAGTVSGTGWFVDYSGSSSGWSFAGNLYWDAGRGLPAFTADAARVVGDPRFVDAAAGNFALAAGSPAIDAATQPIAFTVADDATGTVARPQGPANDLGAFEKPAATSTPPPSAGTGLWATYYDNADLSGKTISRLDAAVDFDWGTGSPDAAIAPDTFSARWHGQLAPATSETYTITTLSDDGVRLWIGGKLLIDDWTSHSPREDSATIALVAGQRYDITLAYFENTGGAVAKLLWSTPTISKRIIPSGQLYPLSDGDGLTATYWNNLDFTGTSVRRIDATIAFDWGAGSPDAAIGPDTFSARWVGKVQAPTSETWTFTTISDDGVRLWVDGRQLVGNWTSHPPTSNSGTIALAAGQLYDIRMDYFENTGGAVAKLLWSSPSTARQVVPRSRLFSAPQLASAVEVEEAQGAGGSGRCGLGGGIALLAGLTLRRRRQR